jgi:hypothetical protein
VAPVIRQVLPSRFCALPFMMGSVVHRRTHFRPFSQIRVPYAPPKDGQRPRRGRGATSVVPYPRGALASNHARDLNRRLQ